MESNDLDLKKPLLPDELIFPIEKITGTLEEYPNLKFSLEKSILTPLERANLHSELLKMKEELTAKQALYQSQFEELKNWMMESFEVESPQILLDHQAKVKEAEMIAEEAATQGNSKQHQRIRALNTNSSQQFKIEAQESSNVSESSSSIPGRASKNLSRMNHVSSGGTNSNSSGGIGGQGQKDLSAIKSKVTNQIPINVFWNYIEPFFKPIDEDDLKYLDDPSHVMDVAPFVIPPLGLHYEKIWYEQYGYVVPGGDNNKRNSRSLNEGNLKNQIHLRDRLLSALTDKNAEILPDYADDAENLEEDSSSLFVDHSDSSVPLDDRLRSSLIELGFTDLTTSRDFQENDEICVEMRSVQRQLREQIVLNQYRKKRLAEFIKSKLASQEFYSLIGDLDKQIDGIFQKRVKNFKKKKTGKAPIDSSSLNSNEIPVEAIQSLENRRKLLDSFVEIIPGRIESLCPEKLVDFDSKIEDQILENAKKSSKWLPLPEIPLKQPLTSCQPAFPNLK